jgi:hypothetical protein
MFYPFPPTLSELAPEKPTLAVGALPLLQAFGGFWVFVKVGDGGGFGVVRDFMEQNPLIWH